MWGVRAAYRIFEYDPNNLVMIGDIVAFRYVVQRALLVCPKGSAKTELIAARSTIDLGAEAAVEWA